MSFTKNQLDKMKKEDIIAVVLSQQTEIKKLDEILNKLGELQNTVDILKGRISVSEKTSTLLAKTVKSLEHELHDLQQYSRRECLEFSGIKKDIKDSDVEEKVCEILSSININIDREADIQACHRIGSKGTVITKFSNRKTVGEILKSKSDLANKNGDKIFINESLCGFYRKLRGRCGSLKKAKLIQKVIVRNGTIKIKINENDSFLDIKDEIDLTDRFPNFNFPF